MSEAPDERVIRLSPNSLGIAACPRRYWYYRIAKRKLAKPTTALTAGGAMHAALLPLDQGLGVTAQEKAIDDACAENPPPPEDFRQPSFIKDCLAQYRAEFPHPRFPTYEAMESEFDRVLGHVPGPGGEWTVRITGRVDRRVIASDGRRYVVDFKTRTRDDSLDMKAEHNGNQLFAYAWAAQDEFGEQVHGGFLIRIVWRKPTKTGIAFSFPTDDPVRFTPDALKEWQQNTLRVAQELVARNPNDLNDWPMQRGLCAGRFGACDYLETCTHPAHQRAIHLASDLYEPADPKH